MSKKQDSPAAYEDVKFVLEKALVIPNLQYRLASAGTATHFKQRCNRYRNLVRNQAQEVNALIPGHRAETAYDKLTISQVDPDSGEPSRQGTMLVFRHADLVGKLIDPASGKEIPFDE